MRPISKSLVPYKDLYGNVQPKEGKLRRLGKKMEDLGDPVEGKK
jgi:hypothetical protein